MSSKVKPDEGRYSRVSRRIWNSADFRALSCAKPNAQTLFFRLLSGPELTCIPGLFSAFDGGMAAALGWPLGAFRKCFAEIEKRGMVRADWKAGLIWVPKGVRHTPPESTNVVKGWRMAWREMPDCALKDAAEKELRAYCEAKGEAWAEAFAHVTGKPRAKPSPKPKTDPSPNQEKEKEKDPPLPPQPDSVGQRAKAWLELADGGAGGRALADMQHGDPCQWAESRQVFDAMPEAWGHQDTPRHSGDFRVRTVVERFAEGYSPDDLVSAIWGAKNAESIAKNREYQVITTILKDGSRVDKYAALRGPAAPTGPELEQPKTYEDIQRERAARQRGAA